MLEKEKAREERVLGKVRPQPARIKYDAKNCGAANMRKT
jgi:hypothetical protein